MKNIGSITARPIGSAPLDVTLAGVVLPPWLTAPVSRACKDENPETFFPEDYGLRNRQQIERARTLCESCPVRDLCLEWAVPIADLDGIWGATTPPERRRMRVARAENAA